MGESAEGEKEKRKKEEWEEMMRVDVEKKMGRVRYWYVRVR